MNLEKVQVYDEGKYFDPRTQRKMEILPGKGVPISYFDACWTENHDRRLVSAF